MDWLRSEDLKEENNVTAPIVSIAGVDLAGGMGYGEVRNRLFCPLISPVSLRVKEPLREDQERAVCTVEIQ